MVQWVDMEAEKSRTDRMLVRDHPTGWGWFEATDLSDLPIEPLVGLFFLIVEVLDFNLIIQYDVTIMKRRAHVLHNLLSGCVQRKDYHVLAQHLPEKHEYIISGTFIKTSFRLKHYFSAFDPIPAWAVPILPW